MYTPSYRLRSQSLSDAHILHCGCTHCDGSGLLLQEERGLTQRINECPECEGHGFMADTTEIIHRTTGLAVEMPRVIPISNDYAKPAEPLKQAA